MASTVEMHQTRPATHPMARSRVLGVIGAALANEAIRVVAVPILGIQLLIRFGNNAPQGVALPAVVGSTVVAALLGWGLLALLERRTSRAREIWTSIALFILLVSLSLPLVAGTSVSTTVTLALMHVTAAAVIISVLRRG